MLKLFFAILMVFYQILYSVSFATSCRPESLVQKIKKAKVAGIYQLVNESRVGFYVSYSFKLVENVKGSPPVILESSKTSAWRGGTTIGRENSKKDVTQSNIKNAKLREYLITLSSDQKVVSFGLCHGPVFIDGVHTTKKIIKDAAVPPEICTFEDIQEKLESNLNFKGPIQFDLVHCESHQSTGIVSEGKFTYRTPRKNRVRGSFYLNANGREFRSGSATKIDDWIKVVETLEESNFFSGIEKPRSYMRVKFHEHSGNITYWIGDHAFHHFKLHPPYTVEYDAGFRSRIERNKSHSNIKDFLVGKHFELQSYVHGFLIDNDLKIDPIRVSRAKLDKAVAEKFIEDQKGDYLALMETRNLMRDHRVELNRGKIIDGRLFNIPAFSALSIRD